MDRSVFFDGKQARDYLDKQINCYNLGNALLKLKNYDPHYVENIDNNDILRNHLNLLSNTT